MCYTFSNQFTKKKKKIPTYKWFFNICFDKHIPFLGYCSGGGRVGDGIILILILIYFNILPQHYHIYYLHVYTCVYPWTQKNSFSFPSLLTKILSNFLVQTCWVLESNYCVHASGDMNWGRGGGGEDPHEKGEEEEDEDLTI